MILAGTLDGKNPFVNLHGRSASLRVQLSQAAANRHNPVGHAIVDLGISGLVPWGHRGTARRLVRRTSSQSRTQQEISNHQLVDAIISEARTLAGGHSILSASLTPIGNSQSLLRKLGSSLDTGSPLSRVLKLERALQALSAIPVISNSDIPRFLEGKHRARAAVRLRRLEPTLASYVDQLGAEPSTGDLVGRISQYSVMPQIHGPLEGARQALERGDPESARQGLNSLRVAIDALIEARGGRGDWKEVARGLVATDEDWAVVRSYHHLLSAASHHGRTHSRAELSVALELYFPVCGLMQPR